MKNILLALLISLCACPLRAQESEPQSYSPEFGAYGGPLLPKRIPGVREVLNGWGVRAGLRTGKGMLELDNFNIKRYGVFFNSTSADYRLDIGNEYLPAHFIIGAHGDYYRGVRRTSFKFATGWHYGGGLTYQLGGNLWFRLDFKYRFSPGNSAIIGVGLVLRFPEGGGNQP